MILANKIKELREQKGWTQLELAKHSGIDRRTISYMENQERSKRPSANALLKIARAFNIQPEELYEAAGYVTSLHRTPIRPETPEEILDKLKLATPVSIPVYTDFPFHAGTAVTPVEYVYHSRSKMANKNIEGYLVHGTCLEPVVTNGDIIIVDREGEIDNGDIIACLCHGQLHLARLRKIAGEFWLENNTGRNKFVECDIIAPVVEVIRRLK